MDNFSRKIDWERRQRFPRIAIIGGLAMGNGMGRILEMMGANVYEMPVPLENVLDNDNIIPLGKSIEFRDPAEVTCGEVSKETLSEITDLDKLIEANLQIARSCDGLFIPGGPHLRDGKPNPRRAIEEAVYKAARLTGVPILGICSGAQLMVLCERGEIIKSLSNHGNVKYKNFIEGYEAAEDTEKANLRREFMEEFFTENLPVGLGGGRYADKWYDHVVTDGKGHGVTVLDEELAKMIGHGLAHVFSSHQMMVDINKLPATVKVTALSSDDGSVEAIKISNHPSFAMGFMFHPEMSIELYEPVVQAFVASAAKVKGTRLR